jgi:hypothetical protein
MGSVGKIARAMVRGKSLTLVSDGILVELGYGRVPLEVYFGHVEACIGEVLEILADDLNLGLEGNPK